MKKIMSVCLVAIIMLTITTTAFATKTNDNVVEIDGGYISECAICCAKQNLDRSFFPMSTKAVTPYKMWISNKLGSEYVSIANVIFDQLHSNTLDELILLEQSKYNKSINFIEIIKLNLDKFLFLLGIMILGVLVFVICSQKIRSRKIRNLIEVDTLTGIMSKYKFENVVQNLLKTAKPNEYFLMVLDMDDFKNINKTYSKEKGDEVLKALSEVFKENKNSFIYIARLQNDNFITLMRNKNDSWKSDEPLKYYNEDFEKNVKNKFKQKLKDIGIRNNIYFSIGIYIIENLSEKLDYMIDCTVKAKNMGKHIYGNTTVMYTDEIHKKEIKKQEIISSMENAVKNEEFFIQIQPKIKLETEKLIGGEVLVRWKKIDGSCVYPDEFIPLFESNNFIVTLDKYILEKTCEYIYNSKIELPIISVNVSAQTIVRNDLISSFMNILNKYSIKPQQIELELTESVLNSNYREILKAIKELKQLGFCIAIDDFGKGASSLARIRELDVDVIKIDKEFIDSNVDDKKGKTVLLKIISMANELGMITLAEGIETQEQNRMLIELGCECGQGYYLAKPLSLDNFTKFTTNTNYKHSTVIQAN